MSLSAGHGIEEAITVNSIYRRLSFCLYHKESHVPNNYGLQRFHDGAVDDRIDLNVAAVGLFAEIEGVGHLKAHVASCRFVHAPAVHIVAAIVHPFVALVVAVGGVIKP